MLEGASELLYFNHMKHIITTLTAVAVVLVLAGAGCGSSSTPEYSADAFDSIDGSLSEMAFDMVADGFMSWVVLQSIEAPDDENLEELYVTWQETQTGEFPSYDAYENDIMLRMVEDQERVFEIWSAGEDGVKGTEDDLKKRYPYREL